MSPLPHRYPKYGTIGLLILLLMEMALLCSQTGVLPNFSWPLITSWATPACWWGYILLVDAWLYRRHGKSLLTTRRELLALQCILSTAFWCLFEGYNRLLPGWRYINLDSDLSVRFAGYILAFATIMPGMFLTCEFLQSYGLFKKTNARTFQWSPAALNLIALVGIAGCVIPPFMPEHTRGYLWAFVWVGWFLMLEPVNYRRGLPSLLRDWEQGDWTRTLQLLVAGAICGLLWEFWNIWAFTKWEYIFFPPQLARWKYFEMPIAGFLGFLPFALDYFAMFHFLAGFFTREDKLGL